MKGKQIGKNVVSIFALISDFSQSIPAVAIYRKLREIQFK